MKITLFYPVPHYKSLQPQEEQNEQYWNEITIVFLEKKHNVDTIRKGFPIEMYIGGLLYELYFITLTLQGQIIIGPTCQDRRRWTWFIFIFSLLFFFCFSFCFSFLFLEQLRLRVISHAVTSVTT